MKGGLASFGRYVPTELVRQLIATGREAKLGGEKTRLAIMFTDIIGFTTLSETLTAEELMLQLSAYLDRMTRIIEQEQGTVDKYIGDGIMAFWGAPLEVENPALLACRAALGCSKAEADLNRQWQVEDKPAMPTCFGIHFGETIVGNVGSSRRMNYSIFGDNVNLASRLEGINRIYGTKIIVSQSVYEAVDKQMICRPLDIVAVKGKKKSIAIHELLATYTRGRGRGAGVFLRPFCGRDRGVPWTKLGAGAGGLRAVANRGSRRSAHTAIHQTLPGHHRRLGDSATGLGRLRDYEREVDAAFVFFGLRFGLKSGLPHA